MRGTLEVKSQKEYIQEYIQEYIHFVPCSFLTHLILTKWQIRLMSSSMDWEREFSLFHENDVILSPVGLAPSMPLS